MNFSIKEEIENPDGSKQLLLHIATEEQVYLAYFLESFEGWCFHSMVKKKKPLLRIDISPDYIQNVYELLEFLKEWEL